MKLIVNFVTFLLVVSIPAFFALITFNFSDSNAVTLVVDSEQKIVPYTVSINKNDGSSQTIQKTKLTSPQANEGILLNGQEAGFIEFGKLATAFFMANQSGTLSFKDISLSGKTLTIDPNYASIVSMYDPFTMYSVLSLYNDFSISQITNGSLYIGKEKDGTYSLYSIDIVVRLDFLDNGSKMTDMVLFPGMYIRFDPKMNSSLSGANLFRILQSLEPNGTEDISSESTGIEFVNPRLNTKNERDSFLMYRLPKQTRLFQMLHILFSERISHIDIYKEYGTAIGAYSDESSNNIRLINPGKKSHLLLLKLDGILADTLKNPTSIESFQYLISQINQEALTLGLGNSVEARLEKFLTDSRFALFGGTNNPQLQDIYQAASVAVSKVPATPNTKLLQKLSDIYSTNLATQKKDLSFSNIDTYTPTALELAKTLQSEDILQRDYFDIALYAFNVLKKMEDRGVYTYEAINSQSTYSLIQTILISTDRYVKGIPEKERKNITYEGIALHFYLNILSALTHSVYATFMVSEDGKLFLSPSLRPTKNDERVRMDENIKRQMIDLDVMLSIVSGRMEEYYGVNSSNNTFQKIKKYITAYHAFVDILDYDAYMEYQARPYMVDQKEETILPQYQSGTLVRYDPSKTDIAPLIEDPNITKIQSLLGNIPSSFVKKIENGYRVNNAELRLNSDNAEPILFGISMVFDETISEFSDIILLYNNKNIDVITDKKGVKEIQGIFSIASQYIPRLDEILAKNSGARGDIRFVESSNTIEIGVSTFPLVP